MKTLNVKRITAVAAGAALLGMGLAFATPVTFQNVPIINTAGQPVVQVVVGSHAQPIDAVSAGDIAAAIGNLAYTSVPVTASVNATQAQSVLKVAVTSASYSLTNQQVWLNESGSASAGAGSFSFSTLIGSVINKGITSGAPAQTKTLNTSANGIAYTNVPPSGQTAGLSLTVTPAQSPYTDAGSVPTLTTPSASSNGGGVTFSTFTFGNFGQTGSADNILQITNAQVSGLLNNYGSYGETENLWITGFPVYNQSLSPLSKSFQIQSVGGAYQIVFNKPIPSNAANGGPNQASFTMLGKNWTILHYYSLPTGTVSSTTTLPGGSSNKIQLASQLTPLTTVYVGHNLTAGSFSVSLTDLGQPNANGVSPASLNVYYNGVLTNTTSIFPGGNPVLFNITGHNLYINVNNTFAGLYAYQKWAKIQLYANVWNVTSGQTFNQSYDPAWKAILEWTNSSSGSKANALYSIIIYATTGTAGSAPAITNLVPGGSFTWITSPAAWKATFVGDTLGGNYDPVSVSTQSSGSEFYQNPSPGTLTPSFTRYSISTGGAWLNNGAAGTTQIVNTTAITDPAEELLVTSKIPNAFSYSGYQSSSVKYDLIPYALVENAVVNSLDANTNVGNVFTTVIISTAGALTSNYINTAHQLTVQVQGFKGGNTAQTSFTFTGATNQQSANVLFDNITNILLSPRSIPGLTVNVIANSIPGGYGIVEAKLVPATATPAILYPLSGKNYQNAVSGSSVQYNQQNGQAIESFTLASAATANAGVIGKVAQYFTFSVIEYPVPNTQSFNDMITLRLTNSTTGIGASPLFILNDSGTLGVDHGQQNNVTYVSSVSGGPTPTQSTINAPPSFRTERGSQIASITPTSVTLNLAKTVDQLQFLITPATTTNALKSYKWYGPYGIGQATNLPNVSIAAVNATPVLSGSSTYSITGISAIKATPSVSSASTPVLLTNLSKTTGGPNGLVILDSWANPASNLILVGSGYVNSLSQTLQSAYNITFTPSSAPVFQAYGANRILVAGYYGNQTSTAAADFIQQLYAQASS